MNEFIIKRYSIVLTDGKTITIDADHIEFYDKTRMIKLFRNKQDVARINMDNVAGWIATDCIDALDLMKVR